MRPRSRASLAACAVAALALVAGSIAGAVAAFSAQTQSAGNVVSSAPDFRAPDVTAVAVGEDEGGATGTVAAGGAYYVYATVAADTGNPPSGIASVTADVSQITAGATTVPLTAGSYSAGGASYNYRSGVQAADDPLDGVEKSFAVTAVDNASNDETEPGTVAVGGP